MSFVLVSPSTESWFQVRTVAARSIAWSVAGLTAASVRMTASIVAIRGWIIPTPLAMPETVTGTGAPSGPGRVTADARHLRHGIRRPERLGGREEAGVGGRETAGRQVHDPDGDLVDGEPGPDHPGGEAQDAQGVDAEVDRHGLGDRHLVRQAGEAGRGVGAAARRDDRLGAPEVIGAVAAALRTGDRQVGPRRLDGSRRDLVAW